MGPHRAQHLLTATAVVLTAIAAAFGAVTRVSGADAAAFVPDTPFGFHSMLYLNSPTPLKQLMFSEAQEAGVSWIRVDISLGALENPSISTQMWSDVRQYEELSQEHHIHVLADLPDTDGSITTCASPTANPTRCGVSGTADLATYSAEVRQLAASTAGVIDDFEIISEADAPASFTGTAQQYAWMLRTAYDAIHGANPLAQVAIGGIMTPVDESWVARVFATPGADAAQAFDIANIHLRDPLDELPSEIASWKSFFAQYGDSTKPIWVTETGYASDPAYQEDPAYRGVDIASGLAEQSAYIKQLLPTLLDAGASKIFVTERDNLTGKSASEGLIGGAVTDADADAGDLAPVLKPSFGTYQQIAQAALSAAETVTPPAPVTAPALAPVRQRKTKKFVKVCTTRKVHGKRKHICRKVRASAVKHGRFCTTETVHGKRRRVCMKVQKVRGIDEPPTKLDEGTHGICDDCGAAMTGATHSST